MSQGSAYGIPIDTDGTLSANSDFLVPSQKAVKTYVDTEISGITSGADYIPFIFMAATFNPADANSYYFGGRWTAAPAATNNGTQKVIAPFDIEIDYAAITWRSNAAPTTETSTFYIQQYTLPETLDSETSMFTQDFSRPTASNGELHDLTASPFSISAGKGMMFRLLTATWATNPTALELQVILYARKV